MYQLHSACGIAPYESCLTGIGMCTDSPSTFPALFTSRFYAPPPSQLPTSSDSYHRPSTGVLHGPLTPATFSSRAQPCPLPLPLPLAQQSTVPEIYLPSLSSFSPLSDGLYKAIVVRNPVFVAAIDEARDALPRQVSSSMSNEITDSNVIIQITKTFSVERSGDVGLNYQYLRRCCTESRS